ncbi:MAG TPA: gamma-glutamyltransferase, partial [Dehalococcoidia bacterium]
MRLSSVEGRFEPTVDGKCAAADNGMVSSAFPDATAAGAEILAEGGNAIDAACATAFALSVCEPQASGLGGQAVGLVHFDGRTRAIDGSSRVPSLAHRSRIKGDAKNTGYRATTVPSLPAVYGWLHEHYGVLPWRRVLEPAIRLAKNGYEITQLQHDLQERELEKFRAVPSGSGARYFLKRAAEPYEPGELFQQPDLATLLELIAREGCQAFYNGDVAAQIDADMRDNDGLLRADDLALIPWPIERRPLRRRYRTVLVYTMPPPGAGRTLLLVMMMLNHLKSRFLAGRTPSRYHFVAETLRKAFLLRQDRPFNPNTYPQIREKLMLRRSLAREMASTIADEMDATIPLEAPAPVSDTTHFSVMDQTGNVASMTQSIELVYGSKAAAKGLGFLYNNYLGALEYKQPEHPYYLRPNAIPWSTATPTIVFRDQRPWLALGSPGSERIFSTVSQFLTDIVDRSATLSEAMLEPRFHCAVDGTISLEAERFEPDVLEHLTSLGYKLDEREPFAFYLGCVQAVLKAQTGGGFQGVADIRRDG